MANPKVLVVGAGPSGLASALALKDRGVPALVADRADGVASAWRRRYDRLRLNTCRPFSHLPGRRFPRGTPMFPTKDQLVAHLERHSAEVEISLETAVDRIERDDGSWVATTSRGDIRAPQVIVATGYENVPAIPSWPGLEGYSGRIEHSAEYRNPDPFQGEDVLVVGPGCSGMEIAFDLAEGGASRVWLAVRTPPSILQREGPAGLPGDVIGVTLLRAPVRVGDAIARFGSRMDFGDLSEYGLPVPEQGVFTRLRQSGAAPTIVDSEVIDAVRDGRIEVVPGVEALEGEAVRLAGGTRIQPDAVICATGYRRGLESMVGHLGVLDERGIPRRLAEKAAAPGMRFVGYLPRPGGLGYMAKEARRAARAIARELGS
jgi:cation diffusion facilitator CzcD-associated flavoprotein CzcO